MLKFDCRTDKPITWLFNLKTHAVMKLGADHSQGESDRALGIQRAPTHPHFLFRAHWALNVSVLENWAEFNPDRDPLRPCLSQDPFSIK